jgi:hypothetical protein
VRGLTVPQQAAQRFAFGIEFKPFAPLTRAEYVRWLVRANNAIFKGDQSHQIRLADPAATKPSWTCPSPSRDENS